MISFIELLKDPPIEVILTIFSSSFIYMVKSYLGINKRLKTLSAEMQPFERDNISYKYEEFRSVMKGNKLVANTWENFSNTLVFSDKIAYQDSETEELDYDSVSDSMSDIQTTSDPLDYFNEDTLLYAHYNKPIIGVTPGILTGCGPLFTFVLIGTAFGMLDFSSTQALTKTIAGFVGTMQVAAMCSVFAVSTSLIFMSVDKFLFSTLLLPGAAKISQKITELFTTISSEKFLVDLLKTTKTQSHENVNLLRNIPSSFATSMKKDITNIIIPYLDSMIFGLNTLNKTVEKTAKSSGDDLGGLF